MTNENRVSLGSNENNLELRSSNNGTTLEVYLRITELYNMTKCTACDLSQ